MEIRPGLAPGKRWVAAIRLDGFGMRIVGLPDGGLPPCLEPHMLRCCCYTTGNVRLEPASGRAPDSPRYKLGTSLSTLGRRNGVPAETRTRDSTFA